MPKVRAVEMVFHGGRRYRRGETYDITQGQLAEAAKRFKERGIKPCFEMVPVAKPKPEAVDDIV